MGAVYSVCGSATMTLASDVLPKTKITEGISRFAFTISIGMAVGPFVGIQVQNHMSSKASFLTVFAISVVALICVSCCKIKYPKIQRKKFVLKYLWNPDTEFEEKLNSIMDMNVLEIGNNKPITIQESASLEDACRLLSESGIKKVPVVNNGKVVGIISRSAITHYITKRYLENEKKA